jgi:arylsulfatase A-like enzyme
MLERIRQVRPFFYAALSVSGLSAVISVAAAITGEPELFQRLVTAPSKRAPAVLPQRRTIVLITASSLRNDHLGTTGYRVPVTPFLDSLIERGTRFRRAVTTVPVTTPALASLLTGSYPHTTRLRGRFDSLSRGVTPIAERMRRQGYRTIAVVSGNELEPRRGLIRGFDIYDFAGNERDAAATSADALARAASTHPQEPVFLWVHYADPGMPYAPPLELARRFDPGYEGRYRDRFGGDQGMNGPHLFPNDLPAVDAVYRNTLPTAVNAHIRRLYAAEVRRTDDGIRSLVNGLEASHGKQWLIVFAADHGESLGEHGHHYEHGDYVYGPTVHVPLAIIPADSDPLAGGRAVDDWVSIIDIVPTITEMAGLDAFDDAGADAKVEGRSLVPFLEGVSMKPRPVFLESGDSLFPAGVERRVTFDTRGRFRSVILDRWKLIWTPGMPAQRAFELFEVDLSLGDERDVAANHPRVIERLGAALVAWMSEDPDSERGPYGFPGPPERDGRPVEGSAVSPQPLATDG